MKKIIGGFGLFFILAMPSVALAQGLQNIPALEPVGWGTPGTGLLDALIGDVANVIFAVLGVIAVVYLIYGGVLYITAGGDAEKAAKGRTAITNAIIGIIIILLAVAIYSYVKTLGGRR